MTPEDAIEKRLAEIVRSIRVTGIVTGTVGVKVTVTIRGQVHTLPRLQSYTPTIGDAVQILGPATAGYLVLGKAA